MAGKQQRLVAEDALWASLPDDLVKKIGDILLSMDDLDYYSLLQAVCGGWRRTTPEHFMPSKLIVLEHRLTGEDHVDDAAVTLLNVKTGRCVEKKISSVIRRCSSTYIYATLFHIYTIAHRTVY